MIIKSFEFNKIDLTKNRFFLLYGGNEGLKKLTIEQKFKKFFSDNTYSYEENEILKNKENFFNIILTKSFFEIEKLIIITRVTDKIKDIIEEIIDKNKETVCIPFYEDNIQTLTGLASNFCRLNKIPISQQSINLIIHRCRGDRLNLQNELEKIENYTRGKNKINIEDILKLTNLAENYSVSELIDGCLSKNKRKTVNILNENNYTLEDCILIIRTFLIKTKRLLKLSQEMQDRRNIEDVISKFKPPIFWKDKETVKQQIQSWSYTNIKNLIYKTSEVELLIKKNSPNAVNILSDFIIEQTTIVSN